ncbi:MAG: type I restriction endonuclease subunit R, EcoR124 family, partial [Candidatus Adiutrix sp.]
LEYNLTKLNAIFEDIQQVFMQAGVGNFEKLPKEPADCGKFAQLFKEFNAYLEAARVQAFTWRTASYTFSHGSGKPKTCVTMKLDENTYLVLAMRYKELFSDKGSGEGEFAIPFVIDGYLTEIDTAKIDSEYMNARFQKYLTQLRQPDIGAADVQNMLDELHKSFAVLSQEEQKYANIFLRDVQRGAVTVKPGKSFHEYVIDCQSSAKNKQIQQLVQTLGLDEGKLKRIMAANLTEDNMNEYGRFDDIKATVDDTKAKAYFERLEQGTLPPFKVKIKTHTLLKDFILKGGIDID